MYVGGVATAYDFFFANNHGEVSELANEPKIPLWEELGITEKQFRAVQHQALMELCRRDFWTFC